MTRHLCISVTLALLSAALPLRAATRSHAGTEGQKTRVWTNDDVERLRNLGLISVVGHVDGQVDKEAAGSPSATEPYVRAEDPEWYAARAARLRGELEYRQTLLREYRQALEDVRHQGYTTGGITLDQGDLAITPEVGIEILERHVNEVQSELNVLDDLARHHDIPPGTLRAE